MSIRKLLTATSLIAAGIAVASPSASADSLIVTNLNDTGSGSLRAAIVSANSNSDADVITFAPSLKGVIALDTSLEITHSVTLAGPGSTKIRLSGQGSTRVFEVGGVDNESTISGLTIESGEAMGDGGCMLLIDANVVLSDIVIRNCHANGDGGGIAAYGVDGIGTLSLQNFSIKSNVANSGGGIAVGDGFEVTATDGAISNNVAQDGGGVSLWSPQAHTFERVLFQANSGFSSGAMFVGLMGPGETTTLNDTTFIGNAAFTNAAIRAEYVSTDSGGASLVINNSTILYNVANNGAGAIGFSGGAQNSLTMKFSTVMYNQTSGAETGGIYAEGPVAISHSVISENRGYFGEEDDDIDVGYLQTLQIDHSLLGEAETSDSTAAVLDQWTAGQIGTDHRLNLYAVPGELPIMMPTIDSPVINGGETSLVGAPVVDARGLPRLAGTRYDIGAVEWQAPRAPQSVSSAAGVKSVTVRWSPPLASGDSAITNYRVFRRTASGWVKVGTTGPRGRSLLIGGLASGRAFTFRVVAINKAGLGEPSRATTSNVR